MSDELQTERILFRCTPVLLGVIDQAAAERFSSRSDFIRGAVVERLRRENLAGVTQLRSASPAERAILPESRTLSIGTS